MSDFNVNLINYSKKEANTTFQSNFATPVLLHTLDVLQEGLKNQQ